MDEIAQLEEWSRGERLPPLRLHLVQTERCNLGCPSCFMGQPDPGRERREVPDHALRDLVDEAIAMGVQGLYLVGGEVLVRRELALDLMARARAAGLTGELTTNGTLLSAATARRIVEMGWDRLQVSADGPTAEINDALRPPAGTLDRIRRGVARVLEERRRQGARHPEVTLATVVSRDNVDHLPAMIDLAAEIGAVEVTYQSLKEMSEHCAEMAVPADRVDALKASAARAAARAVEQGVRTNAGLLAHPQVAQPALAEVLAEEARLVHDPVIGASCFLPFTTAVVHVDGTISPCFEYVADDLPRVGECSLEEAWYGEAFQRFREAMAGPVLPPHCARCCLGHVDHTRWLRAGALLARGETGPVLALADLYQRHEPHRPDWVNTRVRALAAAGRVEEAMDALVGYLDVATGDDLEWLSGLLFEAHRAGRHQIVARLAGRVLERVPDAAYCRWIRGAARGKLGDLTGALQDVRSCLDLPADRIAGFADAVHDTLAELYLEAGDPQRALVHADRALALRPDKEQTRALRARAVELLG